MAKEIEPGDCVYVRSGDNVSKATVVFIGTESYKPVVVRGLRWFNRLTAISRSDIIGVYQSISERKINEIMEEARNG